MLDFSAAGKYETYEKAKNINEALKKAEKKLTEIQAMGYKVGWVSVSQSDESDKHFDIEINGSKRGG